MFRVSGKWIKVGNAWAGVQSVGRRHYQCEHGVYGYRPKKAEAFELDEHTLNVRQEHSNFYRWVEAFRAHSHRQAQTNPIQLETKRKLPELEAKRYGLSDSATYSFAGILNSNIASGSISEANKFLQQTYCGDISIECAYIDSECEREWLIERYERHVSGAGDNLSPATKVDILALLLKSQAWDHFLATKFPSVKRYGGEGAESMMAFFQQLLELAAAGDVTDIVLAMPHRGRLNLLTTLLKTPPAKVFHKFRGLSEFGADGHAKAMGDIASHFHVSEDFTVNGRQIHLSMLHNPSHLEAVNPVSMGKARSKQQHLRDGAFAEQSTDQHFKSRVINVQLHGDAAFAGQGINQEMLMMAAVPHYDVGGTIHMVVNNQVGFTTPADRGRGTTYCTDPAKMINAPVIHVNGDNPEALALATRVAVDYQQRFHRDVFIDLMCFRRWGHNELDDPTFTNPAIYKIIQSRKSVPDMYAEQLINGGTIDGAQVEAIVQNHTRFLNDELRRAASYQPDAYYFNKQWRHIKQASNAITTWNTGVDYSILHYVGAQSVTFPHNFTIHPHLLKTHVNARLTKLANGTKIDWATAEALAIGSLLYQGHNVRISGEDVGRGTFSQRHVMLVDQQTNEMLIPLNAMAHGNGGKLEVANSILSEEAVLAFEYGMAIDNPDNLIIWEAQFGDFFNTAQSIIDTFIASGETKWMYSNNLVLLLPHGYDGAASEHSSCRMERFLQLTDSSEHMPDGDDVNLHIIYPTTPAQYFHALRRQLCRNFRKPLLVVGPKTMLRLSDATSSHQDFGDGTAFRPIIGDPSVRDAATVKRVILCSGKHYYNLNAYRNEQHVNNVAIVRVESLCPFPVQEINDELDKYKNATEFVWSQEEHRNMGAWSFVKPRFENMCGRRIGYSGRAAGATVATGIAATHKIEIERIISEPFTGSAAV